MNGTHHDLQAMAHYISCYGLHRGVQMAVCDGDGLFRLDIAAVAYHVTEDAPGIPECFLTDEVASLGLIESSDRAMACIRAISDVLDSAVCETRTAPDTWVPDYIEHVSTWAMTPGIGQTKPPTVSEVIGRILRAANHAQTTAA